MSPDGYAAVFTGVLALAAMAALGVSIRQLREARTSVADEIRAHTGAMQQVQSALTGLQAATLQNARATTHAHFQLRYKDIAHDRRDEILQKLRDMTEISAGHVKVKSSARMPESENRDKITWMVERFFEAFWHLHFEEWQAFHSGLVEPSVFRLWLKERREEFDSCLGAPDTPLRSDYDELALNYTWGWTTWQRLHRTHSEQFVRDLNTVQSCDLEHLGEVLKQIAPDKLRN